MVTSVHPASLPSSTSYIRREMRVIGSNQSKRKSFR